MPKEIFTANEEDPCCLCRYFNFFDLKKCTFYQVSRLAGTLSALGVTRGSRVVIYMPLVPEAVIAMLATNRIGAIHSVVFGGWYFENKHRN